MISADQPLKINLKGKGDKKVSKLVFSGAFRRGLIEPKQLNKMLEDVDNFIRRNKESFFIFDLHDLTYWDGLGIKNVVPRVVELNKNQSYVRAMIHAPRKTFIHEVATDKYDEIGTRLCPWDEDLDRVTDHYETKLEKFFVEAGLIREQFKNLSNRIARLEKKIDSSLREEAHTRWLLELNKREMYRGLIAFKKGMKLLLLQKDLGLSKNDIEDLKLLEDAVKAWENC